MHIALLALGIGPGDEVIVPAFTMAATWLTVIYTGATPVFVDCERQTYNIDPGLIEKRITKNTKAIMPVHIYGHPAEMDEIMRIAKKYKLYVIEDAAEAHGAEYKGRKCGSFGDFGCFSFYGNKIVTSGEGGMAVTKNKKLAERVRWYKDFCFSPKKRFIHEDIGYNYRATNMQAAFGLGSLQSIKHSIKKKLKMATLYKKYLGGIEGLTLPTTKPYVTNVYWMYAVLVDPKEFGLAKNNLRRELLEKGVDTRDFFYPPEVQPAFKKYVKEGEKFPNTKYISERGFYLPSGLAITDVQIKKVGEAISEIYKTAKK
jgi:perosamine synthetase